MKDVGYKGAGWGVEKLHINKGLILRNYLFKTSEKLHDVLNPKNTPIPIFGEVNLDNYILIIFCRILGCFLLSGV